MSLCLFRLSLSFCVCFCNVCVCVRACVCVCVHVLVKCVSERVIWSLTEIRYKLEQEYLKCGGYEL